MIASKMKIKGQVGLHARPATLFVKEAKKYESTIRVKLGQKDVNGKSILEVLTLGAKYNTEIEIVAQGADEKEALEALCAIIDSDNQ